LKRFISAQFGELVKHDCAECQNLSRTMSGTTWAPNTVTWTINNWIHMLRAPNGAVNPYLLQAVIIAAGLDGVQSKANPSKR
jgi:glutamate---methylamine ligase